MYEREMVSDYPGYDGPTVENGWLDGDSGLARCRVCGKVAVVDDMYDHDRDHRMEYGLYPRPNYYEDEWGEW